MTRPALGCLVLGTLVHLASTCVGQTTTLEDRLRAVPIEQLAERVMSQGNAARGAMVYYTPEMTCVRCHEPAADSRRLGPAIAEINREATVKFLIESLLDPSRQISEGFETQTVMTVDGQQLSGLVMPDESIDGHLVLVDPNLDGQPQKIPEEDIEDQRKNEVSAMPTGLIGAIDDEQSFMDLVRYLVEIKRGGNNAVLRLRPPDSFFAIQPLPEYEADIDHAGLISALDEDSFQRGADIYLRSCARCHGTQEEPGSMPSARRFFESEFKNGNDPYSMYQTLTHGYALMVPQRWMVPRQKYDVIHFIREHFVKSSNADQYTTVSDDYLADLPAGSGTGPDPVRRTPWSDMDYGNFLFNTYESGTDGSNIAYKGIAVRLDEGPGGVSKGNHWILYEHDTMRVAAAWSGSGFIDWRGIHFDDRHNIHPRIAGDLHLFNDHRPGWANPATGSFEADPRVTGRDDRLYGPLPGEWLKYRGLFQYGQHSVLNYTVGQTEILESPSVGFADAGPYFVRTLNMAARPDELLLRVASIADLKMVGPDSGSVVCFENDEAGISSESAPGFDGQRYLVANRTLDWRQNLTIAARIKTEEGGSIICQTANQEQWVPGGTSLFVRGGRLVFDIGWVGAVTSRTRVDDGQWHDVALVWEPDEEAVRLFVDGRLDRRGELESGKEYENAQLRIGFTTVDFPGPQSLFQGEIQRVRAWSRLLDRDEIANLNEDGQLQSESLIADWQPSGNEEPVPDRSDSGNHADWVQQNETSQSSPTHVWAHAAGMKSPDWKIVGDSLCLEIPSGNEPLNIAISVGSAPHRESLNKVISRFNDLDPPVADLAGLISGGPPSYSEVLNSRIETQPSGEHDPFVVDYLRHPQDNPWDCRLRLTGLDFEDADTMLVCAWDGSVWRITGFLNGSQLNWRRIASGLFQPLGIRVVNEQILVTCRDQIVALEDLNGDGYIDFYRAFNSDHQVTEHFHEFAMGLQSDDEGNLYYAKSARHALPALVPHHGTLLKVSADGGTTEILANGFRAANGVCLNPDGSFYVTDQEGHWNPKNRINWVRPGGFYGNMLGYHDVTDDSDDAMEQPLCWITNAFDRSPGELLWVPDDAWGPIGGTLLNLSYGMGQIFVVPHEQVQYRGDHQLQGGMCALPIDLFPTGVMRGRFHENGDLYSCGMYAWAGNQQQPGGLYRVRYTGQPVYLPKSIKTSPETITIEFASPLDAATVPELNRYSIETWDIRRSSDYGSPHLNSQELKINEARIGADGKAVELSVAGLRPTRCMEIRCLIRAADGRDLTRVIHNSIHAIGRDNE